MPLYNLADVVDKTIFSSQDVDIYTNKPLTYGLSPVGIVKAGNPIGVMYSWVTDKDGTIYLQFQGNNAATANTLGFYYVSSANGVFSASALKEQGVLSVNEKVVAEQKAKEKAGETLTDKAERVIKYGIVAAAVVGLFKVFVQNRK